MRRVEGTDFECLAVYSALHLHMCSSRRNAKPSTTRQGLYRSQTRKQIQDNKKAYKDTRTASGKRPTVGAPYARARYTRARGAGREVSREAGREARPWSSHLDRRGAGMRQSASYHARQLRARRRSRASRSTPGARKLTSTTLPPPALATGELSCKRQQASRAAQPSTRETKARDTTA
jgi:hypothetical protein